LGNSICNLTVAFNAVKTRNKVSMDTLLRVFTALKATVKLQIELPNLNISVG
jgi:hypothetical protein